MKILVIGNGFDLEHGLPTKYKDFLDFMQCINFLNNNLDTINKFTISEIYFEEQLENEVKHTIDSNVKKYFCHRNLLNFSTFNKWSKDEKSKELIECANKNIWIKYFLENIEYDNQGWIDFESEISDVIQCFDYMKNISKYYEKDGRLPENLDDYKEEIVQRIIEYSVLDINEYELIDKNLKQVINVLNEHLNNLIRCLEIYLEECVGQKDIKYVSPDIKDIEFDKVLSFNYTDTYEKLYGINNDEIEYDYIHGKADITRDTADNNMVLGIDEYLNDDAKNNQLEFITFKKYFQRIYKMTGNTYKKWILKMVNIECELTGECDELGQSETQKITNQIYIFGHSLDITDKDILKELIEFENAVTTIFYYNRDVYAQQITNLVKLIGQDELIKRVSGANPTIIFKQQQNRIRRNK